MAEHSKTVVMCTSRIFDIQNHAFIKKLNETLHAAGVRLLVYALNTDIYWDEDADMTETFIFDLIPMWKADALLFMDEKVKSHTVAERVISRAKHFNIPVLVADGEYEGCVSVRFDFKNGFERLVRHIIEDHHVKKPHFMAGIRNNPFSDERIEIFKKVLAENGMEYTDEMLSYGEFWAIPARKAMNEALDKGIKPDAVICANDFMAINVLAVLKERGFKVPEDVLVTGFDGINEARICEPDITTCDCNTVVLADQTAKILMMMIAGEKPDDKYTVLPEFITGRSCGCNNAGIEALRLLDMVNDQSYRYQDDMNQFYEMTMRMQMSKTPDEMASQIYGSKLSEMFCLVNTQCFERSVDYFKRDLDLETMPPMCLLYDSKNPGGISSIDGEEIMAVVEERISTGYPLIFNLLHYMKKPMGYVCFCFEGYDISEYAKTSSISSYLSLGLGGFVNMRYQQYLFEKLEDTYKYDHLTGLYNRQGFTHALEKLKEERGDEKLPMVVIMADLDGLKYINDFFGHEDGDNAIAVCAKALKDSCPPEALCLRFGGDEMLAFILGECDPVEIVNSVVEKLDAYNATSGRDYTVSASCGAYTTVLDRDSDMEDMVRRADEDMYKNKKAKKRRN